MPSSKGPAGRCLSFSIALFLIFTSLPVHARVAPETLAPRPHSSHAISEIPPHIMEAKEFLGVCMVIADHLLRDGGTKDALPGKVRERYRWHHEVLAAQNILLREVSLCDGRILAIPFYSNTDGAWQTLSLSDVPPFGISRKAARQRKLGGYYMLSLSGGINGRTPSHRDLTGPRAVPGRTDQVIRGLIGEGAMVEIAIDEEDGRLRGDLIRFGEGFGPFPDSGEVYRIRPYEIGQLFTADEIVFLSGWLKRVSGRVADVPVKLRLALGRAALNWEGDIESANIAHAGVSRNVIYLGSVLLKHMLREEGGVLFRKIMEEDELQHLKGFDHGGVEDERDRLRALERPLGAFEELLGKLAEGDVQWLRDRIGHLLGQGDRARLAELMITADHYLQTVTVARVEGGYPVKKAVALLRPEEQDALAEFLLREEGMLDLYLSAELLLMLLPSLDQDDLPEEGWALEACRWIQENWVERFAPELKGRSLWQISPEIWHEAGGLARVMQYHGAAKNEMIQRAGVRYRQVEPHYQNRITAAGEAVPLDYRSDITYPIRDLERLDLGEFFVDVGGKRVQVEAHRGTNEMGMEIYLVRDLQEDGTSFYTHSLYNYREGPDGVEGADLPTWNEFSTFYSRASLELMRRIENREREESLRRGDEWKPPLVHLNDSQVALVPVYRMIELERQLKEAEIDASREVDPVLRDAVFFFTTHTYGNRRDGQSVENLDFMGIPQKYRDLFENTKFIRTEPGGPVKEVHCLDMASAGLRTAHGQSGVAWPHRDDVAPWDEWVNDPRNPRAIEMRALLPYADLSVRIRAISNGDHRAKTAIHFHRYLRMLEDNVNVDHPSPEQVLAAKKIARAELSLRKGTFFWSEKEPEEDVVRPLDPERPVVSYSGRLVWEKAGRGHRGTDGNDSYGALTDRNIIELVRRGAQVVYYGNVHNKDPGSRKLKNDLVAFAARLKVLKRESPDEYPGRFVFVPRFSLGQQRMLLAASDIGVHDSYPATEAAGFTEADDAVCGGIVVAPLREGEFYNHDMGEGLFQSQGRRMDFAYTGVGNTLVPERLDSESYLAIMLRALELYDADPAQNRLMHYQATSVRLSRILEARLTSAAYLQAFSETIAERKTRREEREHMATEGQLERQVKDLLRQMAEQDSYTGELYAPVSHLARADAERALESFYVGGLMKREKDVPANVTRLMNILLSLYHARRINGDALLDFLRMMRETAPRLLTEAGLSVGVVRDVQVMASQAEMIAGWMDEELPGAADMRLTHEEAHMVATPERGRSFIDSRSLRRGIAEVKREGEHGFYWRGLEDITTKLAGEVLEEAKTDGSEFEAYEGRTVLYVMDHGFMEVPRALKRPDIRLSTIHETMFVHDTLPGSVQAASTGAGHYQGNKLDIKQVRRGRGVQVNVRYDEHGDIVEVIAQKVEEGDWFVALPGYVDYVINLGGLKFNDISYELSEEEAAEFITGGVMTVAPDKACMKAPLAGVITARGPLLVKAMEGMPEVKWITDRKGFAPNVTLLDQYKRLDPEKLDKLVARVKHSLSSSLSSALTAPVDVLSVAELEVDAPRKAVLFDRAADNLTAYAEENELFLRRMCSDTSSGAKLIRIPEDLVNRPEASDVRDLLRWLKERGNIHVELFSPEDEHARPRDTYGLMRQLPDELASPEKRDRSNTITILPVERDEQLSPNQNVRWRGQDPTKSIIMPVGHHYDGAWLLRSLLLGLRLSEINRLEADASSVLATVTFRDYLALCRALDQRPERVGLRVEDLINIARADGYELVESLNKLIEALPMVPLDVEQKRRIHNSLLEVLKRA